MKKYLKVAKALRLKVAKALSRFDAIQGKADEAYAKYLELKSKAEASHKEFREMYAPDPAYTESAVTLEIPLAEYLSEYPDAAPTRQSCNLGEYLRYPDQSIGESVSVWARTACVAV